MPARAKTLGRVQQSPETDQPAERPEIADDRRRHPRSPCDIPVVVEVGGEVHAGRLRNVSCAGALIISSVPLEQGRTYDFLFIPPGDRRATRVRGQVRWALNAKTVDGPHCMGVEFAELLPVLDSRESAG